MFRRRRGPSGWQSKQFVVQGFMSSATAQGAPIFFAADQIIVGPDELFGAAAPIQASMKKVSVVGIDYYFDGYTEMNMDPLSVPISPFNYQGIYKDTLDNAGVPDASGDMFLQVDQVNGTTNQQLFPERILDRRSFSLNWGLTTTLAGPWSQGVGANNPGIGAERRIRRRVSITNREAIIHRVEAQFPAQATGTTATFTYQIYGVITYRVSL